MANRKKYTKSFMKALSICMCTTTVFGIWLSPANIAQAAAQDNNVMWSGLFMTKVPCLTVIWSQQAHRALL